MLRDALHKLLQLLLDHTGNGVPQADIQQLVDAVSIILHGIMHIRVTVGVPQPLGGHVWVGQGPELPHHGLVELRLEHVVQPQSHPNLRVLECDPAVVCIASKQDTVVLSWLGAVAHAHKALSTHSGSHQCTILPWCHVHGVRQQVSPGQVLVLVNIGVVPGEVGDKVLVNELVGSLQHMLDRQH